MNAGPRVLVSAASLRGFASQWSTNLRLFIDSNLDDAAAQESLASRWLV